MGLCSSYFVPKQRRSNNTQMLQILSQLQSQSQQINSLFIQQELSSKSKRPGKVSLLKKENTQLRRGLKILEKWRLRAIIRNIVRIYTGFSVLKLHYYFQSWKSSAECSLSRVDYSSSDEFIDEETINFANTLSNSQSLLSNNILVKNAESSPSDKPMASSYLMKLFDDILDKKYEADNNEPHRPIRPFPDFTLEFLKRSYGLKNISATHLSSLIKGLYSLYESADPYGVLICRLLQLFDPQPIPLPLAAYLTKVRVEFIRLTSLYEKDHKVKQRRQVAYLFDAMNLVYSLFENDLTTRGQVLRLLCPQSLSPEEYFRFRVSYKMLRIGYNPDQLFSMLDFDSTEVLSQECLVRGLRRVLEISVPKSDFSVLSKAFPFTPTGLSREGFVSAVNPNSFYSNSKLPEFSIDIAQMFQVLIQAYDSMRLKDTTYLRNLFFAYRKQTSDFEKFSNLVLKLDSKIEFHDIQKLYAIASEDGLTCESFCKVALDFSVGGVGIRDFKRENVLVRKLKRGGEELSERGGHNSPTVGSPYASPSFQKYPKDVKNMLFFTRTQSLNISLRDCL